MKFIATILFLALSLWGKSQLCLGNSSFTTAAWMDPAWFTGCDAAAGCAGAATFSNMLACEPNSTMDGCAPTPDCCTSITSASDLWWFFCATGTTVTINVIPSNPFTPSIQAFAPGFDCAALTPLGCTVASGPGNDAQLVLNGLTPGAMYWFRVYGCSPAAAQRVGTFCFCGSSGMCLSPLPVAMELNAGLDGEAVELSWTTVDASSVNRYEVQYSSDGITFQSLDTLASLHNAQASTYAYVHEGPLEAYNYYRIKAIDDNGSSEISNIEMVISENNAVFSIAPNPLSRILAIQSSSAFEGEVLNLDGSEMMHLEVAPGNNEFAADKLANGTYFVRNSSTGAVKKFIVLK